MSVVPVWAYRFTAENREHVVTFAEHPLHWEDAPIVLNTYRLDRFDAKVVGAVIADALNVHEATGLTPTQLQARVAELEAALSRVQKLTGWEAPDAGSGAALNFNQGYESALEDVAAALGEA